MNKMMMAAALALAATPMMGGAEVVRREPRSPIGDWLRANGKLTPKGKRETRDVSRLLGRSFPKEPVYEPKGYFWKQDLVGTRWRLYRAPTAEMMAQRHVIYDEANDRSIVSSAWGYVNPQYVRGDAR